MKNSTQQKGISLVEVMVALVIGLFLAGGVLQVYTTNQSTYRFTEAVSRIQENGRFALDMIAQDLRMGRFWGCAPYDPDNPENMVDNLNPGGADYDPLVHDFIGRGALEGSENDGLNGSDGLIVRGIKSSQASVRQPYNTPTSADVHISTTNAIEAGDIVMISNCEGADIFQVTGVGASTSADQIALSHTTAGSPGNLNVGACSAGGSAHCLSRTYGADAMISELQAVTYSIAAGTNGVATLWRSENGLNEELIDGVEAMQVLYGIDTDNDGSVNRYLDSDAVADMNAVYAVRIRLLLQSSNDGVVEQAQTYTFAGNDVIAADRRLRQVFSATIGLRNPGDS